MNGRHALDLLEMSREAGDPPCVALIDLRMPVMDGWELLAALERDGSWRKLKVIVSSGSAISDGSIAFAHARIVWAKPIDPDKLQRIQDHCPVHARAADGAGVTDRAIRMAELDSRVAKTVGEVRRSTKRRSARRRVHGGARREPALPRSRPSRSR
jgi:CheY-like chemotaxis protein